jgi:uncharacterized protein YdhG (YjbR/CyaY superfamily)
MAKTNFTSVGEYLASQPKESQRLLQRVRRIIRKAVPQAEEVISYQMPAFKLRGRIVLYFAGWQKHYSLYPVGKRLVAALRKDLAPYEANEKGTVRFPLSEPVPAQLIENIARFRAQEVAEAEEAKAARRKTR